jgi:hypothetical protein
MTPVSLLAVMIDHSRGRAARIRENESKSTAPAASTATASTCQPPRASWAAGLSTQGCSVAPTAITPGRQHPAEPLRNRLLASLPPLVNTTSVGWALTAAATCCRASSIARRAARPYSWRLEALPKRLSSHGSIAASTAGSSGVVALWSK